ncbi:uncharacterized protein LOC130725134 [Lotus japonicus]|uniref:uncharacterized protein LOC130725134 n=1 Tax=Lotus japonicus TaxID=34305 RepID=UPI00258C5681|nr:uncharacterized protein LOC130725134 [Lotus japonicus]
MADADGGDSQPPPKRQATQTPARVESSTLAGLEGETTTQSAPENAAAASTLAQNEESSTQQGELGAPPTSPTCPTSPGKVEDQTSFPGGEKEGPPRDRLEDPATFLISHPFFEKLREGETRGSKHLAQEALPSLLSAGCLLARTTQNSESSAAEIDQLQMEVEELRTANQKAYEYRDKLVATLAAQETKMNKVGAELGRVRINVGNRELRIEELEGELAARAEIVTAKEEALAATNKELDFLKGELLARDKASDEAKVEAEAKPKAEVEAKAKAETKAKVKAEAEAKANV